MNVCKCICMPIRERHWKRLGTRERLLCVREGGHNRKRTEANLLPDSLQVERTRKSQWIIMELLSLDVAIVELLGVCVAWNTQCTHRFVLMYFFGLVHSHSVLQYFHRLVPARALRVIHTHKCMFVCCVSLWTNEMNLSRVFHWYCRRLLLKNTLRAPLHISNVKIEK